MKYRYSYSEEELRILALTYNTRIEFNKANPRAYSQALRKKLMDKICTHMKTLRRSYTKAEYLLIVKQFKSVKELCMNHKNVYMYGCKRGWNKLIKYSVLNDINSCGELTLRYFLETIFNTKFTKTNAEWIINPKTNYRLQLDGYSKELGIAFEHQGRQHYEKNHFRHDSEILYRDKVKRKACKKNNIKLLIIPDITYYLQNDEKKIKDYLIKEFIKHDIKIPKKFKTTAIKLQIQYKKKAETIKQVLKIAARYKTQKEFIREQHPLYKKLVRHQMWAEITLTIWNKPKVVKVFWTPSLVKEKADKYKTRMDFKYNDKQAYQAAIKLGILQSVCSHMPKRAPQTHTKEYLKH